jgi:hypothetical protein
MYIDHRRTCLLSISGTFNIVRKVIIEDYKKQLVKLVTLSLYQQQQLKEKDIQNELRNDTTTYHPLRTTTLLIQQRQDNKTISRHC